MIKAELHSHGPKLAILPQGFPRQKDTFQCVNGTCPDTVRGKENSRYPRHLCLLQDTAVPQLRVAALTSLLSGQANKS